MLYERWMATAATGGDRVAVREPDGRVWTFARLAAAAEAAPVPRAPVVASGNGVPFLIDVLRAWRAGVPLVPVDGPPPRPEVIADLPGWVAHVKLTSGSTGEPKLIVFRDRQLAADAEAIVMVMGLDPAVPNVAAISMAHSYGFSNLVTPLLLAGIPMVLAESALPRPVEAALEAVAESAGRAVLPAVPAMWRAWHEAGVLRADRVALAVSAGAALPPGLGSRVAEEAGIAICDFYGASECGGIAFASGGALRPLPGVRLSLSPGGCLEVRGPAVGECYWPPGGEGGALGCGVYRTSDRAELGRGGEVILLGRAGDSINVAGRKVEPGAVETVITGVPEVEACVVFGVPSADVGRGDDVVALVRLAAGAGVEAVRRAALSALPAWQVPRVWVAEPSLGPDGRGKISRRYWREQFLLATGRTSRSPGSGR